MLRKSNARSSGISSLVVPILDRGEGEMHHIYSGWAMYFFKRDPERTEYCFGKCLELNPWDANSLYLRSAAKRDVAAFDSALKDALAASQLNKRKPQYDFEVCENYNNLKQFEKCKAELHNGFRKYRGKNAEKFGDSIEIVNEYLKDCLGPALEAFIKKHKARFPEVVEMIQRESYQDERPRWKVLKEQGKCDVVSIDEKEKIILSPMEKARRERWYRIFNQIYFGRNWVDKVFLKNLSKNQKFLPEYFLDSTPLAKETLETENEAIKKFVKILHARSPLYVEQFKRFGNQKFAKKHAESYLFGKQYQARRKIFNVLLTIKEFRKNGKLEAMSKYIEEVMGDYVTIKTNRIMPRKFEFINEVYNIFALAQADLYIENEKNHIYKNYSKNRLQRMLGLDVETKPKSEFVFGDRSTYVPADAEDTMLLAYKNFLERMEYRLNFAKFPIEKAYLWHEIACAHLKRNNFGECQTAAKRAVEAAKECNSNIYAFLSQMLIVKGYAAQHKIEYCHTALKEAAEAVSPLKNSSLTNFVEMAAAITDEDIDIKKSIVSIDIQRRRTPIGAHWATSNSDFSEEKTSSNKVATEDKIL